MVVLSWGFNSPTRLSDDKGLSFMVSGFKYQGRVDVYYNEETDLFDVCLHNGVVEEDVYLDCLVDVIDGLVERIEDYQEKMKTLYCLEM